MKLHNIFHREYPAIAQYCYVVIILLIFNSNNLLAQAADTCCCATIDFESIPGDSIYEGLIVHEQYAELLGMTFMLEDSTFPHIADVGGNKTAFESAWGDDTPAPGQNTGKFFLTDDGLTSGLASSPLLIIFSIPVDSASGYMLDIDATEQFTIQAIGDTGQILYEATIKAGDQGTGDGQATKWHVKRDTTDIWRIRLAGKRTAAGFFGLGFDNFTSCSTLRINSLPESHDSKSMPETSRLFQNYPNPFNPTTAISLSLDKPEFVELKVYNALGKEVNTLISRKLNQGYYTYQFYAGDLASGIYYYQLVAGAHREIKKMILLK